MASTATLTINLQEIARSAVRIWFKCVAISGHLPVVSRNGWWSGQVTVNGAFTRGFDNRRQRELRESGSRMTVQQIRLGLVAGGLIAVSVLVNLLMMQPDRSGVRPERAYRGLGELPGTRSTTVTGNQQAEARSDERAPQVVGSGVSEPVPQSGARADDGLVASVQRELSNRGYVCGNMSGALDTVTRAAIMAFEHDRGLDLTGQPSSELLAELRSSVPLAVRSGTGPRTTGPEAEAVIRAVQQSLSLLSYRPGAADGVMGQATAGAIRAFERDQGLPETGRVSGLLLTRLAQVGRDGRQHALR